MSTKREEDRKQETEYRMKELEVTGVYSLRLLVPDL